MIREMGRPRAMILRLPDQDAGGEVQAEQVREHGVGEVGCEGNDRGVPGCCVTGQRSPNKRNDRAGSLTSTGSAVSVRHRWSWWLRACGHLPGWLLGDGKAGSQPAAHGLCQEGADLPPVRFSRDQPSVEMALAERRMPRHPTASIPKG